ncbi:MAG: FAD-dependent oxidoreductase, partial [Verrucomicrobia bacterium]|nr:FAD-dependent oxidoreductase [Verrucomicrobiota bacterium]
QEDIVERRDFADGFIPTTWDIDLHYPREQYAKKFPENPFISRAEFGKHVDRKNGYPVPYRCLYSKNIPNLFMAGRNISVTHQALGTVRVMRTGGMMGELVGKAAYLAVLHNTSPRGVYEKHLPELITLAEQPGATRRDSLKGETRLDPNIRDPKTMEVAAANRDLAIFSNHLNAENGDLEPLKGLVINDTAAKLTGNWTSTNLRPNVGGGSRISNRQPGAEARFEFKVPTTGKYEVRLYWAGHENRASNTLCKLELSGQSPVSMRLNQKETPGPKGAKTLGVYELKAGDTNALTLVATDADGNVVADAVQVVPVH